ncbi:two-component system sensor histidine kinase/response regulator [Pseudomonas sp. 57B-090624]|uniref:PAS domain S-box protein n=2 Tax=unclassified Pseudomonas TaxID=196821 RepID=UPI000DA8575B|nr:PAS domain S-box protein [Pseudomonas sp. 57B-090624]PZE11103.1 two-component system sensor histidine kinase/response regulator [Pseudomonas sp. 57B-090624]
MSRRLSAPVYSMLAVVLAGVLATALVASQLQQHNQQRIHEALERATDTMADAVVRRLGLYQYGLRGARGALVTVGEAGISRELFNRYARSRDIAVEFPGARGFGLIRKVAQADEADFLRRARADGKPDFTLRQISQHEGDRFVIQYLEPVTNNAAAIGLDIASESNRREAALAAMRSGEVRLTAPITLVQAIGKPLQSFLMLMPIYQGVTVPGTVEERERQLVGWSYAPLLTEEVLDGLQVDAHSLQLRLRDITTPGSSDVFYESAASPDGSTEVMSLRVERSLYGRHWEVELAAYPAFTAQLNLLSPRLAWGGGLALTCLLAALVGANGVSGWRKQQVFEQRSRLAAIVESSPDGIIGQTLDGVVTSWNAGAEAIFGYDAEEAIGHTLKELIVPVARADEETDILRRVGRGERLALFDAQRHRKDGSLVDVSLSIAPILDHQQHVVGISKTVRDITAQKRAEARILELNAGLEEQVAARTQELTATNVLLDSVLSSASEVSIIATDADGLIRVFNRGAERLLGYTAKELVGRQTPALLHVTEEVVERGHELSERFRQPIQGFRVFVHVPEYEGAEAREWTYVRKNGTRFPVTLVVTAIRDASGKPTGYLGIALDITERKAAEHRLQESLATTRAVLDTAVNPVITFGPDGRIQSFNPAGGVVFGCDPQTMPGRHLEELVDPASREAFAALIASYTGPAGGAGTSGLELWGLRGDGSSFPMQLTLAAMGTNGEQRLVCVVTDLTEQHLQRKSLLAARDQLLLAAEVAELGIWSWTLADDTLQWNARMFEIYGQPPEQSERGLLLEHWQARVHPEDIDRVANQLRAAIDGSARYEPIFRIVRPDGQVRFIQAAAQIERDAQGQPTKVTGINRDITAQRELESRLLEARDRADAASAAKSFFLANMSHEIRTPMNAVLGMLQLVQGTALNERQLDYVLKAQTAARSLLGLLNDILDYSKIEAGKLQLDPHDFELEALMRDLAVVLAGNQGDKDVEVMFDLDARVPQRLIGDSFRLQQVLINLAGNALKFTSVGQVVVGFHLLDLSEHSALLRVSVSDTGIGISPEQMERIFDGFTQAEASTSRRFGGTGLGLVICKRLVELMGARLQVESQPGQGSRFWFDVTLDLAEPGALRAACPGVDAPLRLLVVDDNPVAGEVLLRTLLSLGWQAEYAATGEAAVNQVREAAQRQEPFDLVLMDWRMPGLDGLAASEAIQAMAGELRVPRILMITAHGSEVLADRSQQGGAPFAGFLTKPVTPMQLASAVQRALGQVEAPVAAALDGARRRLAGLRLLVVEDNALNRQVASELLAGEGAEVRLAEGGLEGVQAVLGSLKTFDAVLMDVQMPDIDGLEATRRIRADGRYPTLPIIAMTANAAAQDRQSCLDAGMDDHVGKPIDIHQLVATLLRWTQPGAVIREAPPQAEPEQASVVEPRAAILARFGGNQNLLMTVLASFATEMQKQMQHLRESVASGDLRAVVGVLHGLKGSSGTMGASALCLRSGELEQQGLHLAPEEAAAFLHEPPWVDELQALLQRSSAELDQLFPGAAAPQAAPPVPVRDPHSEQVGAQAMADWQAALGKVMELLETGSLAALDHTEPLLHKAPPPLREACLVFVRLVDELDFEAARECGLRLHRGEGHG